jgi:hypothetical protein
MIPTGTNEAAMGNKTYEFLKQHMDKAKVPPPKVRRMAKSPDDPAFDQTKHSSNQESDHNKPERTEKGASKH